MKKIFLPLFILLAQGSFSQITKIKDLFITSTMLEVNGKLLFAANDTVTAYRYHLWISDGTVTGTQQLKPFANGMYPNDATGYHYYSPIVFNGELYFEADDGTGGALWKSDGTLQGTVLVKSFNGNMNGPYNDQYPSFCILNNELLFAAGDNQHGMELWKTDGTTIGTMMVKDIAADNFLGSIPSFLTNYNNMVYFSAWDETHGVEIWKSDGTETGTQLLKDILPGTDGVTNDGYGESINPQFTVSGGYLYFTGHKNSNTNETYLYRTDGTDAGTIILNTTITKYAPLDYHRDFQTDVNGEFYFMGYPPSSDGSLLYKSDGTENGTVNIPANNNLTTFGELHSFNGKLYFHGEQNNGAQDGLCMSDGTTLGTSIVYAFPYISSSPDILEYVDNGSTFFFRALMAVSSGATSWRMVQTNGTTDGTKIYFGTDARGYNALYNGDIYFLGLDTITNNTYSLYRLTPLNVGVNEVNDEGSVNIFPDPASSEIFLRGDWKYETVFVRLYDLEGRMIREIIQASPSITMVVSDIPSGTYLLKISNEKFSYSHKVVVLH